MNLHQLSLLDQSSRATTFNNQEKLGMFGMRNPEPLGYNDRGIIQHKTCSRGRIHDSMYVLPLKIFVIPLNRTCRCCSFIWNIQLDVHPRHQNFKNNLYRAEKPYNTVNCISAMRCTESKATNTCQDQRFENKLLEFVMVFCIKLGRA